jgi:hypothetical protein
LKSSNRPTICYLCGKPLTEPISDDHVPPKQIFARSIRKVHPTNLLKIPVHSVCNRAYQLDEDYFLNTLAPFALGSYSGNAVLIDVVEKFHRGEKVPLVKKVLAEFDLRPSGLIIPGKVVKRFDGKRLRRIVLKIIRGLFFHHYGKYLPEELTADVQIIPPDERPPDHFSVALGDKPEHGRHVGVFAYKYAKFPEVNDFHYWGMLLWDQIIIIAMFHDPDCKCSQCVQVLDE